MTKSPSIRGKLFTHVCPVLNTAWDFFVGVSQKGKVYIFPFDGKPAYLSPIVDEKQAKDFVKAGAWTQCGIITKHVDTPAKPAKFSPMSQLFVVDFKTKYRTFRALNLLRQKGITSGYGMLAATNSGYFKWKSFSSWWDGHLRDTKQQMVYVTVNNGVVVDLLMTGEVDGRNTSISELFKALDIPQNVLDPAHKKTTIQPSPTQPMFIDKLKTIAAEIVAKHRELESVADTIVDTITAETVRIASPEAVAGYFLAALNANPEVKAIVRNRLNADMAVEIGKGIADSEPIQPVKLGQTPTRHANGRFKRKATIARFYYKKPGTQYYTPRIASIKDGSLTAQPDRFTGFDLDREDFRTYRFDNIRGGVKGITLTKEYV